MNDLTMPTALGAGTDWSTTLQNIVAYGAGRMFDAQAVSKIYKSTSNQTPYMMDSQGNLFIAGQPNQAAIQGQNSGTFPLIFLVIGGAFLFLALRD